MRYCQACGQGHDCPGDVSAVDREVEIERLRTRRDIEVARIQASAAKDIAETDAEHSSEHAEGLAEGMETAIEAIAGGGEPDGGEGTPIVVSADTEPEPEPEEEPESAPEVVEVATPRESKRGGYWSNYR